MIGEEPVFIISMVKTAVVPGISGSPVMSALESVKFTDSGAAALPQYGRPKASARTMARARMAVR